MNTREQLKNIFINGAVGDALGAGLEAWKLSEILNRYGNFEKIEYTRETRVNKEPTKGKAGDVTDDTSMTMCVMAALCKTITQFEQIEFKAQAFMDAAVKNMHQAFLYWGQNQNTYSGISGAPCKAFLTDNHWPELDAFNDTFGAGEGTISVLCSGVLGTMKNLPERKMPDGTPAGTKYVEGCGALMRVAPVAALVSRLPEFHYFEFGCRSAVITHGDAASYLAAGIFCELMGYLDSSRTLAKGLSKVRDKLIYDKKNAQVSYDQADALSEKTRFAELIKGYEQCLKAIQVALTNLNDKEQYEDDVIDKVGYAASEILFNTPAVLAQVIFVALVAEKHNWTADKALKFAITQSGDSDSVASIVGHLLGAMGKCASYNLIDGLNPQHLKAVLDNCEMFSAKLDALQRKVELERSWDEMENVTIFKM